MRPGHGQHLGEVHSFRNRSGDGSLPGSFQLAWLVCASEHAVMGLCEYSTVFQVLLTDKSVDCGDVARATKEWRRRLRLQEIVKRPVAEELASIWAKLAQFPSSSSTCVSPHIIYAAAVHIQVRIDDSALCIFCMTSHSGKSACYLFLNKNNQSQ
jgi:hypothetical protein